MICVGNIPAFNRSRTKLGQVIMGEPVVKHKNHKTVISGLIWRTNQNIKWIKITPNYTKL